MDVHLALLWGVEFPAANGQDRLLADDLEQVQEHGAVGDVSEEVVDFY